MKKLLFIVLLASISIQGFSQKLEKYEDVLPRILVLPPSGALAQLKIYLAEEPENPSIYLQMAVLNEQRYKDADPIKDYAYKLGNAQEALKAYNRTVAFLTEKDVRRNSENYFNFGKVDEKGRVNVEYDSIKSHLDAMMAELDLYIRHMPTIYEKFTQSFSHYDQAYKLFTKILGDYPTFKDLYLLYTPEVDQQFEQIKKEYQASMKYWEEYLSAKDSLAIGYNQQIVVQPVKVYRLDGLESKINFLKEKINVWDYASWVDETRETIGAEIDKLRRDLAAENIRLNKRIEQAQPDFIRDEFEALKVTKEILFNLRKYDLNSVIEPIFLFKEKKHNLIYQSLMSETLNSESEVDVDRKLYLYGQMINYIKDADSVLADIKRRNTQASLDKYEEFIRVHYKGQSGINNMVATEKQQNAADASTYVSNIRNELYGMLRKNSIISTLTYKKLEIPLTKGMIVGNDQLTVPITTHRIDNFDGSQFIGGIYKNEKEGLTQAYICGVTADKKIGWFNEYLLQMDSAKGYDSHTRIGAMAAIPGGVAVILNGVDSAGIRMNHLLLLDEKGITTHSRRLLLNLFPRTISFNERTNTLFVTYKAEDYQDDILLESELIMTNYSIYGDLLWQKRMNYKGSIAGVVSVNNGYMVVGNYNELKGLDGRIQRAGRANTDTKVFTLKINQTGEIEALKTINNGQSFFANKTYKVSDDCINLFGSEGSYMETIDLDETPETAVHIIVNKDLEILASSLK